MVVGLVAVVIVLVAAAAVFAVARDDSGDAAASDDTCGSVDEGSLTQAALGLGLDGGTGAPSCNGFGDEVRVSDATEPVAMRITYVNQSDRPQNVSLRLQLPEALDPDAGTAAFYGGATSGRQTLETVSLLWSGDGLKLGTYQPDESAVVIAYAAVDADSVPASGCEQLRDPVTAYASSRGGPTVSARLMVTLGADC